MYIDLSTVKTAFGITDETHDVMLQVFIDAAAETIHQKTKQESLFIREIDEVAHRSAERSKIFLTTEIINDGIIKETIVVTADGEVAGAQISPDLSWKVRQSHFVLPFPLSDMYFLKVKYDTGFFTEDKVPASIKNLILSIVKSAYSAYKKDKDAIAATGEIVATATATTPQVIKSKKIGNTMITYDTSSESVAAAVETSSASSAAIDLYNPKEVDSILSQYKKKSSVKYRA